MDYYLVVLAVIVGIVTAFCVVLHHATRTGTDSVESHQQQNENIYDGIYSSSNQVDELKPNQCQAISRKGGHEVRSVPRLRRMSHGNLSTVSNQVDKRNSIRVQDISRPAMDAPVQSFNNLVYCESVHLQQESRSSSSLAVIDNNAQNLHGHGVQVIQKDADIYIKTNKYVETSECLKHQHHVTIIGSAGTGKTAMAYQLLREYQLLGYIIILVKKPDELRRSRNTNKPTIILLNDMFGRSAFSPTLFHEWKNVLEEFEPLFGYGTNWISNCKLVCTSRNYIWSEAATFLGTFRKTMFSENTIIDLTNGLSFDEKKIILEMHRQKHNHHMDQEVIDRICKLVSPHGFPHTCFLFFDLKQFHNKALNFFERPLPCLEESIQDLANVDTEKYVILVLVLLYGGDLEITSLTNDNLNLGYIKTRFPKINIEAVVRNIEATSIHLCSSFLKMELNVLQFHHPTIHDTVAYILGKTEQQLVIQNCSVEFLFERVRISVEKEGLHNKEDSHLFHILLPRTLWTLLTTRFAKEIKELNFPLICSHQAMSNPDFVRQCFATLIDEDIDIAHAVDHVFSRSMLTWSMWNKADVLCTYLLTNFTFTEETKFKSLVCCCSSGNIRCMSILLKDVSTDALLAYKTKRTQYEYVVSDKTGTFISKMVQKGCSRDSLILLACTFGHKDVIELLLKAGFSIHDVNDKGDTALHKCCMGENASLVPYLLEYGCEILARNKAGNVPLQTAAEHNSVTHVDQLLRYRNKFHCDSQLSAKNQECETALLIACKMGHRYVVQFLIKFGADVHVRNRHEQTPIVLAIKGGHQEIVDILLRYQQKGEFSEGSRTTAAVDSCPCPIKTSNVQHTHQENVHQYHFNINIPDDSGDTPLMLACQNGDVSIATKLVSKGVDINSMNKSGYTPLMTACENNNEEVVCLLLDSNASVNVASNTGYTPLMFACVSGNDSVAERLLSQNANFSAKTSDGDTPLILACKSGSIAIVCKLLPLTMDTDVQNKYGHTALFYASKGGHLQTVKLLLSKGVDVDKSDGIGNTPLIEASMNGHVRIADLLVTHGANVNAKNSQHNTALHIACKHGYTAIAKMLLRKGAKSTSNRDCETPLLCAVKSHMFNMMTVLISQETDKTVLKYCLHSLCITNNEEYMRNLMTKTVDVDVKDDDENTPLMLACRHGQSSNAIILLEAGSDVNTVNIRMETALMIACEQELPAVVELLISKFDAEVNLKNSAGETALILSCKNGNTDIIWMLLDARALLNLCNREGDSALIVTSERGHIKATEELLSKKANIDYKNKLGNTAMMCAAKSGHFEVLKCLLIRGAYVNVRNNDGDSALILTCRVGFDDETELLLSHRADTSLCNKDGNTPLLIAAKQNNSVAVTMLLDYGADVNITDNLGDTALIWAARHGFEDVLEVLIMKGADIDTCTRSGESPLWLAVLSGNCKCMELVMSKLKRWDNECSVILCTLCEVGHKQMVEAMLPWSSSVSILDDNNNTPLMNACTGGHPHVVEMLLNDGMSINDRNKEGDTALLLACKDRHLTVVDILLSHGAEVTGRNCQGETPINIAFESRCETLWSLIFSQCQEDSVNTEAWQEILVVSCLEGNLPTVQSLVQRGMTTNLLDKHGIPILTLAVQMNHADVVAYLVVNGVDVNREKGDGKTALFYACEQGNESIVRTLLSHAADLTSPSLLVACEREHELVIELLLMHDPCNQTIPKAMLLACRNASENIVSIIFDMSDVTEDFTKFDDTPLTIAASRGSTAILKLLISHGIDVNQQNRLGDSPLILACMHGHLASVELLLEHKADLWVTDTSGNNLFKIACQTGSRSLANFVLRELVNSAKEPRNVKDVINAKSNDGKTALIAATEIGDEDIVHVLIHEKHQDVDIRDSHLETALMIASRNGNDRLVKQLLSVSANVNMTNNNGETALILACMEGHVQVAELLLKAKAECSDVCAKGFSPLYWACKTSNNDMAELLLKNQAQVNMKDNTGLIPLMHACQSANLDLVLLLLKHRADICITDNNGNVSIWHSVTGGCLRVWQTLASQDKDTVESQSNALLIHACRLGHLEIAKELVSLKADVNGSNIHGDTPLTVASDSGNKDVVMFLISNKAIVNMCNNSGHTPLMLACRESHGYVVKLLLKHKAMTNSGNNNGITPLMFASMQSSDAIVGDILAHGACVDTCDNKGDTALIKACRKRQLGIVCTLLKHHASISVSNNCEETPFSLSLDCSDLLDVLKVHRDISDLFTACEIGNLHTVKGILLPQYENSIHVDVKNKAGSTPLLTACKSGHINIVNFLLSLNAFIEITDTDGNTALHIASFHGHAGIPTLLMKTKIDTVLKNKGGYTAYMIAKHRGHEKIADELLPPIIKSEESIFASSRQGKLQEVKQLVSTGEDINKTNGYGETPLMLALYNRNVAIVAYFIAKHADLDIRTQFGDTPLIYACKGGDLYNVKKVLSLLDKSKHANVTNIGNDQGITPVMISSMYGHTPIVKYLLERNADTKAADSHGNTALLYSCRYGHHKITKLLLKQLSKYGCLDVQFNKVRNTPLHEACIGGHLEIVKTLLAHKVDVNSTNVHGDTALTLSSERGFSDIVVRLLKYKADINHTNNDGFTPLMQASRFGHTKTIQILLEQGADITKMDKSGRDFTQLASQFGYSFDNNGYDDVSF